MATFSVTYTFIANTKARAAEVNQNFSDVLTILSAHHHDPGIYTNAKPITNSGIAANAEILATQLQSPITRSGLIHPDSLQVVTIPKGGTGLAGFAAGDLLYALNASTLVRLALGTTDQYLRVDGATTLPAWKNGPSSNDFGDGADGAADFDGAGAVTGASRSGSTYTLTRDVYYTTATVRTGVILKPAGYRIYCLTSLTLEGTATIHRNGENGGNGGNGTNGSGGTPGSGGSAGTAGAALSDGYLKGSAAGGAGGGGGGGQGTFPYQNGNPGSAGSTGGTTTESIGSSGTTTGGNGGAGGGGEGGASAGAGGTATAARTRLIYGFPLSTFLDIKADLTLAPFQGSGGNGGAGGGSGGGGEQVNANGGFGGGGGGGGGTGGNGGTIFIAAATITIGASASISAVGGTGGNGGNGGNGHSGSDGRRADGGGTGGGGGGGNGGFIALVYQALNNSGSITVAGGSGGTRGATVGTGAGSGGGAGSLGVNGSSGATGTLYEFQV